MADARAWVVLSVGWAAAASIAVGCGVGGDADTDATATLGETRNLSIPDDAPGEVEELSTEAAAGDYRGIDYASYNASIEEILYLLDDYWASALPQFGYEYSSPANAIAYYPAEDNPGCGGEPLGKGNASYCPADDVIAWDEPGLMIPFYAEVGDAAVGFVLAHEWGHLIQDRVGLEFERPIHAELNADCLAGDFAAALADEGLLEGGASLKPGTDLAEAAEAIFAVGDDPSVPWQDPQAHGTGQDRIDAFTTGFEGRSEACVDSYGPDSSFPGT